MRTCLPVVRSACRVLVLALLVVPVLSPVRGIAAELLFFRVIQDSALANRQPERYEKLTQQVASGQRDLYIEKSPYLRIDRVSLKAVVVEKDPVIRDSRDAELYLALRKVRPEPAERSHVVTFFVERNAAMKLRDLGNQSSDQFVDLRVDDKRLVTAKVVGQFGAGGVYSVPVGDHDTDRLRTVLAPLKDIVIWK